MGDEDRYLTLADLASELADPHQHVERIPYWNESRNRKFRTHRTTMPGLLQQMADLMLPSNSPDAGSSPPKSRPPGNWAALADHTAITLAVAKWCWDLRLDQRGTVEGNVRQLVGASGGLDADTRKRLTADMRRWHRMAQYVTGWATPPAEVRAPCPALKPDGTLCGVRSLRINYTAGEAYCATCGTCWDSSTVGLLAETVRAYNAASRASADAAKIRARKDTAA